MDSNVVDGLTGFCIWTLHIFSIFVFRIFMFHPGTFDWMWIILSFNVDSCSISSCMKIIHINYLKGYRCFQQILVMLHTSSHISIVIFEHVLYKLILHLNGLKDWAQVRSCALTVCHDDFNCVTIFRAWFIYSII